MSDTPTQIVETLIKGDAKQVDIVALTRLLRDTNTRPETLTAMKNNNWEGFQSLGKMLYTIENDENEFKSDVQFLLGNVEAAEAVVLVHPVPTDTTEIVIEDPSPNENIKIRVTDSSTFVEVVQNDKLIMTCDDLQYNGIDTITINSGHEVILPHDKLGYILGSLKTILATEEVTNNIPTVVDLSKGFVFYLDRVDRVTQFVQFTGLSPEESERRLKDNRYNLELAMSFYFEYAEGSGNTPAAQAEQVAGTEFETHFDPENYGPVTRRKRRPPTQSRQRDAQHLVTRKYVARLILNQYYTLKSKVDPKGDITYLSMTPENNAADWTIKMKFDANSPLQLQLTEYARSIQDESRDCLVVNCRFGCGYPNVPPEFTLRNPRLKYLSAPVSFGGRIAHGMLTPGKWNPDCELSVVIEDIHSMFERSTAEVCKDSSHIRGYESNEAPNLLQRLETMEWPTENDFDGKYICHSSATSMEEFGIFLDSDFDRIVLPGDEANRIYGGNAVSLPLIFEITTENGRKRHCGTSPSNGFEQFLPSGHVILPEWVFRDLFLSDKSSVRIRCVEVPAISFVKLQPHSKTFYQDAALCESTQSALQSGLKGMAALTEDTTVSITLKTSQGDRPHQFEVVKIEPAAAVRLICEDPNEEIEFKVDFTAAPDHEESEDRTTRMREQAKRFQHMQQKEREEAERAAAKRKQVYEKMIKGFTDLLKEGNIEVSFKMPDGETLRGRFPEGEDTRMMYAFVACNSKWAKEKFLLPHQMELATTFPKKIIEVGVINSSIHRALVAASEGNEKEGLERLDTLTSLGSRLFSIVTEEEVINNQEDVIIATTAMKLIGSANTTSEESSLCVVNMNGLTDKDYKERPIASRVIPFEILHVIDRRPNFLKVSHCGHEFHIRNNTVTEITRVGLEALITSSIDHSDNNPKLGKGLFALVAADKYSHQSETIIKQAPSKVQGYIFGKDDDSDSSDSDSISDNLNNKVRDDDDDDDDDDSDDESYDSSLSDLRPPAPPPRVVPPPPPAAPLPPPVAGNHVDEDELDSLVALCPHVDRETAREILSSCLSVTAV